MTRPVGFWTPINVTVLIYFLTWGLAAGDRLLIAMLFPFVLPEFGLEYAQAGLLMAAMSGGYLVFAFVGGLLSDRIGRKKVILPSVFIFSIGSAVTGFAGGFASLVGYRTVVGAAEGSWNMAATAHIAEECPPEKRGLYIGFYNAAFPLFASFIAPIYATLIAQAWGWRWACILTIVPGLILVPVIAKFVKESGRYVAPDSAHAVAAPAHELAASSSWFDVLKQRNVLTAAIIAVFWMIWLWSWLSFGTMFFTKIKHYDPAAGGVLMSALGAGGCIGSFLLSAVSDKIGRKPVVMLAAAFGLIGTLAVIYLPAGNLPLTWLVLFVTAFMTWGIAPVILSVIASESVPPNHVALGVAIVTCLAEFAGIIIAPPGLGALADAYGLSTSLLVAAAGLIPMFLLAFVLQETAPRVLAARMATA